MGVDTSGEGLGVNSYAGGGQADVQMVVVLDNINQTWQMLQLNRDSIVQVPVRGVHGDIVAYDNEQLALAYYYGDGREQSCENTVLTVSTLLNSSDHRRLCGRQHGRSGDHHRHGGRRDPDRHL